MIEVTTAELLIIMGAIVAAVAVLRPYVPIWAWFTFAVLFALNSLIEILDEGPVKQNVGGIVIFSLFALGFWWRDLRRGLPDGRTIALIGGWAAIGLAAIVLRSHVPYSVTFALGVGFVIGSVYMWLKPMRDQRPGSDESSAEARDRRQQGP